MESKSDQKTKQKKRKEKKTLTHRYNICTSEYELQPKSRGRIFVSFFFFSHPIYYLRPSFYLPPIIRNLEPGSHFIAGSSPPSPIRFVTCIFIARRFQLFFPRRLASQCAYHGRRSQQQTTVWSFFIFSNKFKISPRGGIQTSRISTTTINNILILRSSTIVTTRHKKRKNKMKQIKPNQKSNGEEAKRENRDKVL